MADRRDWRSARAAPRRRPPGPRPRAASASGMISSRQRCGRNRRTPGRPRSRRSSRARRDSRDRPAPNACRSACAASCARTASRRPPSATPAALEVGPLAVDEIVLDHPLPERLVHHRRGVVARRSARRRGRCRPRWSRARSGRPWSRETGPRRDPVGQVRVDQAGELQHDAAHHRPLSGRLSQDSTVKGRSARRRAALPARAPESRAPSAAAGIGQVVEDVGWSRFSRAGRRIVAIALLGDRQRDDPDRRVRHAPQHGGGILGRDQHVLHAPRSPAASRPRARARPRYRRSPAARARRAGPAASRLTPTMPQSPPEAAIASAT